jgi:hypothetical protein
MPVIASADWRWTLTGRYILLTFGKRATAVRHQPPEGNQVRAGEMLRISHMRSVDRSRE